VATTRSGAQSVERAIAVLRALEAGGAQGAGVTDVAHDTGLTASTAHRLVRALCAEGLAVQDPASGRYQLGPALVVLGQQAARTLGYDRLRPLVARLVEATGESANLGILVGGDVLVVLDVPSPQPLRFDQDSGTRVPAHTSAMGKALLAFAEDPEAAVAALPHLERRTERTITDRQALIEHLAATRRRGWSLNDGERDVGVLAIGAPVHRRDGSVGAAVAIQGPASRLTDERLPTLAELLVRATTDMTAFLP
jgi:IclR family acetate operon transcriptional repressor